MFMFAIPIMLGTILQTLFNACDLIVVRMYADSVAVASVAATSTVTNLFVTSVVGLSTGVNIVLARLVGSKEYGRVKRLVSTSLVTAVVVGVIVALVGVLFGEDVLRLMNCPEDCFDGARTYFIIYVICAPFILVYNFGATIIRTDGDSFRPLFYLAYAGVFNVGLNLLLCILLENKVLAVAIATVMAQILGAILTTVRLLRVDGACRFSFREISFDFTLCKILFRYGIPGAITNASFAISNLLIQGAINSFGSSTIAGNAGSSNIESMINSVNAGFHTAISVFIGQNIGANKPERVKKTCFRGTLWACGLILVLSSVATLFEVPLLKLFVGDDPVAIAGGLSRNFFVLRFYTIYCFRGSLRSILNGFGYSKFTMVESLLSIVLFRIVWMSFIYPLNPTLNMANVTYLLSVLDAIAISTPMILYVAHRYKKGYVSKI